MRRPRKLLVFVALALALGTSVAAGVVLAVRGGESTSAMLGEKLEHGDQHASSQAATAPAGDESAQLKTQLDQFAQSRLTGATSSRSTST